MIIYLPLEYHKFKRVDKFRTGSKCRTTCFRVPTLKRTKFGIMEPLVGSIPSLERQINSVLRTVRWTRVKVRILSDIEEVFAKQEKGHSLQLKNYNSIIIRAMWSGYLKKFRTSARSRSHFWTRKKCPLFSFLLITYRIMQGMEKMFEEN